MIKLTSSGGLAGDFNNSNTPGANFRDLENVAIDPAGDVWVTNFNGGGADNKGSVTELTSSGRLTGNFNNSNTPGANFANPRFVAIDAAGNAWVTSDSGVTELTSGGALAGFFNNTNTSGAHFINPVSIAIDDAGNVWVTNFGSFAAVMNSVSELIGVARPVRTPLVACLTQSPPHAVCLP